MEIDPSPDNVDEQSLIAPAAIKSAYIVVKGFPLPTKTSTNGSRSPLLPSHQMEAFLKAFKAAHGVDISNFGITNISFRNKKTKLPDWHRGSFAVVISYQTDSPQLLKIFEDLELTLEEARPTKTKKFSYSILGINEETQSSDIATELSNLLSRVIKAEDISRYQAKATFSTTEPISDANLLKITFICRQAINWCQVFLPVKQLCSNCWSEGHFRHKCKESNQKCPRLCGANATDHPTNECQNSTICKYCSKTHLTPMQCTQFKYRYRMIESSKTNFNPNNNNIKKYQKNNISQASKPVPKTGLTYAEVSMSNNSYANEEAQMDREERMKERKEREEERKEREEEREERKKEMEFMRQENERRNEMMTIERKILTEKIELLQNEVNQLSSRLTQLNNYYNPTNSKPLSITNTSTSSFEIGVTNNKIKGITQSAKRKKNPVLLTPSPTSIPSNTLSLSSTSPSTAMTTTTRNNSFDNHKEEEIKKKLIRALPFKDISSNDTTTSSANMGGWTTVSSPNKKSTSQHVNIFNATTENPITSLKNNKAIAVNNNQFEAISTKENENVNDDEN